VLCWDECALALGFTSASLGDGTEIDTDARSRLSK
jgi:hypothetical protein